MTKRSYMLINAIECPLCADQIFSMYNHDWRSCACGGCMIDGGQDAASTRVMYEQHMDPPVSIKLKFTAEDVRIIMDKIKRGEW